MNLDKLKELASGAIAVVRAKQPANPVSWYSLLPIKNALYNITDSDDLDVADADAAFIAAAKPSVVLALIEVAEKARAYLDSEGSGCGAEVEHESALRSALSRLEESNAQHS